MNQRIVKKIKKYAKRNWMEYLKEVKQWPFSNRWRLCWFILFGKVSK